MKKNILSISLIGLSAALNAAIEPNLNVGYVNFQTAFTEEHEAQKITKDLENDERLIIEGEQKARTTIETKMVDFQKRMAVLTEDARQKEQAALSNEINALQQQFNQKRSELNQKRDHLTAELEKRNRDVLNFVREKESLDLIYNSVALVSISDKVKDVTPKVVAEYNRRYPVKPEATTKAAATKATPKKPAPKK